MTNELLYIGGDDQFLPALETQLSTRRVRVYVTGSVCTSLPNWGSFYTVLLDCETFAAPIEQFDLVRSSHPHAPIIMLDRMRKNPLGYVALAKLHGADSFHWKPIDSWTRLLNAIDSAFLRMSRWQQLLDQLEPNCLMLQAQSTGPQSC